MKNIYFLSDEIINDIFLPDDETMKQYEISDELSERVLKAMGERRAENEQKAAQKKPVHKTFAFRAAVIAATITVMILVIPSSRQVVVNAAESAWWWITHIFEEGDYQIENLELTEPMYDNVTYADDVDYGMYGKPIITHIGSFNSSIKVDCLTYTFSDLYMIQGDCNGQEGLYLKFSAALDNNQELMPNFGNYITIAAQKNNEVVCIFKMPIYDYYMSVVNCGSDKCKYEELNMGYRDENGNRINHRFDDEDGDIYVYYYGNKDEKKPWEYNSVSCNLGLDYISNEEVLYYNFDKYSTLTFNKKTYSKLISNGLSGDLIDVFLEAIKEIEPDKYVIISVNADIDFLVMKHNHKQAHENIHQYNYFDKKYKTYEKLIDKKED